MPLKKKKKKWSFGFLRQSINHLTDAPVADKVKENIKCLHLCRMKPVILNENLGKSQRERACQHSHGTCSVQSIAISWNLSMNPVY